MRAPLVTVPLAAALSLVAAAQAWAGCSSGCASCCLPTAHTVQVPGVNITPPRVTIAPPGIALAGVGSTDVSVDVQASAATDASAYSAAQAQASAVGNSATVANLLASGGGSSFYVEQGPSSTIGQLDVSAPAPPAPVCLEAAPAVSLIAIQATCLDDKDVPHPASQVMPGRDVPSGYVGELYRCIAGARMQYVTGAWTGAEAAFGRGQSAVCRKGEALWRGPGGAIQCRAQIAARDCNERSLLRRYGAGIKLARVSGGGQCVRWSTAGGAAEAQPSLAAGMSVDGGVGGVAR